MGNRSVVSKDQILDAAYDIATTQGLGALSIRAVAAACGVAVGTVYNSYPTKSELINDVVGKFWRQAFSACMGEAEAGEAMTTLAPAPEPAPISTTATSVPASGDGSPQGAAKIASRSSDEASRSSASCDFVAFCQQLADETSRALEEFRGDFLDGLTALGAYDLAGARRREAESFAHVRRGLQAALARDPAIHREKLTGALAPERLCDLVWETLVDAARHRTPLDGTLFALLREALYD